MADITLAGLDHPGHLDDWYDEVHSERSVFRSRDGWWMVAGYDCAREVLRDPRFASGPIGARFRDGLPPGAARTEMGHRINFMDPPDHPRLRRLVLGAFTARRVDELVPFVERLVAELLDELDEDRSGIDLLNGFAHQVPSVVISEMLGVPVDDRAHLTALSDEVAPLLSVTATQTEIESAIDAAERQHGYLDALIEHRRREPGTDLLSALVAIEEEGERLSIDELRSLAATLYSAGHRTTRDLFANSVELLGSIGEPLRSDAAVVNELLRLATPTQYVVRIPTVDVELSDIAIPAWQPILVLLGAANRDPSVFTDPHAFEPGRRNDRPPLSFAPGPHLCIGAHLARMEVEVMLAGVSTRWPELHLDSPVRFRQRGPFRGPDSLIARRAGPHA